MIIFKTVREIRQFLLNASVKKESTGFVPTMGALHKGHLSLIDRSTADNDVTVCSIFVNPSQFNNPEDFRLYPVTIEKDIELLIQSGCDVLFLPSVSEIYPADYKAPHYDLGDLETILEGKYRPGHFQGVCQVVDRLLAIVAPSRLYLGSKDYQQCMVLKKLIQLKKSERPEIVIGDTVREDDGLAMSSRNARLNEHQKKTATTISQTLYFIRENFDLLSLQQLKSQAVKDLENAGFDVDYVEISDAATLEQLQKPSRPAVALIAASIGNVRLIDNMVIS